MTPPAPLDFNIILPESAGPGTQSCSRKAKITWTNQTGKTIDVFTLPTCVSPQQTPAPIANNTETRSFTVNQDAKNGSYEYSYHPEGPDHQTRSGTIDIDG